MLSPIHVASTFSLFTCHSSCRLRKGVFFSLDKFAHGKDGSVGGCRLTVTGIPFPGASGCNATPTRHCQPAKSIYRSMSKCRWMVWMRTHTLSLSLSHTHIEHTLCTNLLSEYGFILRTSCDVSAEGLDVPSELGGLHYSGELYACNSASLRRGRRCLPRRCSCNCCRVSLNEKHPGTRCLQYVRALDLQSRLIAL